MLQHGDEVAASAPGIGASRRGSIRRLLVSVGIANAALYALYIGVLQVLLPLQVEAVDRAHKVATLGLVSGISAGVAAVCNPLGGALSDRTRSRFGRRTPWLLVGSAAVLVAVAVLGSAASVLMVIVGWSLVQAAANLYQAALTAVVPDRVPVRRRGTASAVVGVAMSAGAVAGVGLAGRFAGHLALGYFALGLLLAITAILFVSLTADPPSNQVSLSHLPPGERPAPEASRPGIASRRGVLSSAVAFTSALRHRDFAWVFCGRAAMILGYFLIAGFELYILTDYVRLPSGISPTAGVTILAVISTLCSVLAAAVAGPLSDRLNRRKLFVIGSAAISGLAMILPIVSPTFPTMTVFAAIAGLAFGSYLAVDTALVTLVLPRHEDTARDMGVLNVANAGPQIVAPFLAALIIGHLGGYKTLFIGGGVIAIAGALAIGPVRSVR
ncbi:MAG: MFS transporter [Streptosporangiaceae bacterium]